MPAREGSKKNPSVSRLYDGSKAHFAPERYAEVRILPYFCAECIAEGSPATGLKNGMFISKMKGSSQNFTDLLPSILLSAIGRWISQLHE